MCCKVKNGNLRVHRLHCSIAVCDGAVNAERKDKSCPVVNMKIILWEKTVFTACGVKHRRCCLQVASSVLYTTSCKHSLVLLRIGKIIARNMLGWLKLLIKLLLLHLVGCLCYSICPLSEFELGMKYTAVLLQLCPCAHSTYFT